MSKESYNLILTTYSENLEVIIRHKEWLLKMDVYNNLNVRLGFDAYYSLLTWDQRNHIVKSDNLKDRHLETGILKALKQLGIS